MPFLLKKIEINIVEQNSSELSFSNSLNIDLGYGGYYVTVSNFISIIQNFDYVIEISDFGSLEYYGVKNKNYNEIKINY